MLRTLFDGFDAAGMHQVQWDGTTSSGVAAPAGVYYAQLVVNNEVRMQKMVLLK